MERFNNGSDVCGFRSLNNSTSKRVLNLLEPVKLTVWKVMIEKITVVKFKMDDGGGNGAGCFEVKVRADTAKFTNMIVARFRKCSVFVREDKVFVKNKTRVVGGVGCTERRVMYFRKLLFKSCCLSPVRRNSVLEELRVRRLAVIQEEICCRVFCK